MNSMDKLKYDIRHKAIDIWKNPDNPPEDKLIDILEYTTEQIVNYFEEKNS